MAKVIAPMFSTWASGSYGKSITYRHLGNMNIAVVSVYQRYAGKRYPIQDYNASVFRDRMKAWWKAKKAIIP